LLWFFFGCQFFSVSFFFFLSEAHLSSPQLILVHSMLFV
jgi:hypothetical protein